MSADNWAHCPRCTRRAADVLNERAVAVQASYGKVPVNEFDEARRQYAEAVKAFEHRSATFREDYEITGAADGVVLVEYSGSCAKCHLSLDFSDVHIIPGADG